ncbi:MAG: SGNH/GDSL hydrolase family protein [Acidobacteriota bacterium]
MTTDRDPTADPPGAGATALRRVALRTALVVFGGLVAAGVAEVGLRWTGLGQPSLTEVVAGDVLKKRPHARHWNHKERRNLVELNRFGFHDAEPDLDPCRARLVFQGDSFVEGEQVPVAELLTSEVRRRLDARPVEVINAAVSGTGTAAQYSLWRHFVQPQLDPDLVVLGFYIGNDLENNHAGLGVPSNLEHFVRSDGSVWIHRVEESALKRAIQPVRAASALVNTVYERLYLLKRQLAKSRARTERRSEGSPPDAAGEPAPVEGAGTPPDAWPDAPAWRETVDGTVALLRRWRRELAAHGAEMGVVVIGAETYFRGGSTGHPYKDRFLDRLVALDAAGELPVLGLRLEDAAPSSIYFPYRGSFGHFNARGHRLAGAEITAWLEEAFPRISREPVEKRPGC